MAKTTNLGLELTENASTKFLDWREIINGNKTGDSKSNTQIIDSFAGETRQSIQNINQSITDIDQTTAETRTLAENAYGQGGSFTIAPESWQSSSYTISIAALKVDDAIFITPATDSDNEKLISAKTSVSAIAGSVTFTVEVVPTSAVTLNYFVAKGKGAAAAPICYFNVQNKEQVQGNVQADFITTDSSDPSFIRNNPFEVDPLDLLIDLTDESSEEFYVTKGARLDSSTSGETSGKWIPNVSFTTEVQSFLDSFSLASGDFIHATCTCDQGRVDLEGKVREIDLKNSSLQSVGSMLYVSDIKIEGSYFHSYDCILDRLIQGPYSIFFGSVRTVDTNYLKSKVLLFFKFPNLAANTSADALQLTNIKVNITKGTGTVVLPLTYVETDVETLEDIQDLTSEVSAIQDDIQQIQQDVGDLYSGVDGLYDGMPCDTCITLYSTNWEGNLQLVDVRGVTPYVIVFVSPAPESYVPFCNARIRATEQENNSITFMCDEVPAEDVNINLVIMQAKPRESEE